MDQVQVRRKHILPQNCLKIQMKDNSDTPWEIYQRVLQNNSFCSQMKLENLVVFACCCGNWTRYAYEYSQQNHFTGTTIASLNHSLQVRLMWKYDTLDLRRIFFPQMRKLRRNLPLAGPNMKVWLYIEIKHNR